MLVEDAEEAEEQNPEEAASDHEVEEKVENEAAPEAEEETVEQEAEEEPEVEEVEEPFIILPKTRKLANQFNFCERAALTMNYPSRVI